MVTDKDFVTTCHLKFAIFLEESLAAVLLVPIRLGCEASDSYIMSFFLFFNNFQVRHPRFSD